MRKFVARFSFWTMTWTGRLRSFVQEYLATLDALGVMARDLQGSRPATLTLDRLPQGFPMGWEEQKALLLQA